MDGRIQVAQASSGRAGASNSGPTRIFKLTKPLTDQAVVINLGYDQKTQVDFSAIANEKITLVHIGEKLIILFDNQSTVTVEPFFDSRHDSAKNLTIEVAPGRELSVSEFAAAFPITTDTSVLPAAGVGTANAQASGANFNAPLVDPLPPVPTNRLAPPEDLGNWQSTPDTGTLPVTPENPLPGPTIVAGLGLPLNVDESWIGPNTPGPAGIGSHQGPGSNTDTRDFSGSFTVTAPAGVQSVTYALTVNNAATNLTDSLTGQPVVLVQNGANEVDGVIQGTQIKVFTLIVDAGGHVTFTELRGVHQGTGEAGDISEGATLPSGSVSLTATVTDNANATATASIDLGPLMSIHDDGPSIQVVGERETPFLSVDESYLANGSTPDPSLTHDSGNFAGVFTKVQGADGASVSYGLQIPGTDAPTNLVDSATGQTVVLEINATSTVVSGYVSGHGGDPNFLVFTIEVNAATADVTLTQFRAVHETTPGEPTPDVSEGINLASGLVTLVGTIIDVDGDTASAGFDLGNNIGFRDDGPSIVVNNTTQPTLSVDESYLPNGSTPNAALTVMTGNFSTAFTAVQGADGATIAYTLGVSAPNVDSGLIDSASGQHVLLSLNGGVVEGRTAVGGDLVFTLSVSSSGVVTLTDYRAVHEGVGENGDISESVSLNSIANLVTLTATITDVDGDHQAATIDLGKQVSFLDDGPTAGFTVGVTTVSIDESAGLQQNDQGGAVPSLFPAGYGTPIQWAQSTGAVVTDTSTGGADGKVSVTYALTNSSGGAINGVDSGFKATATGNEIFLFTEGNLIVGRELNGSGKVAFAIALDGSNNLDVALYEALKQDSLPGTPDDFKSLSNLIYVTQTVTDGDGDTATKTSGTALTVNFYDDGPVFTIVNDANDGIVSLSALNPASATTYTGQFVDWQYGADGFGNLSVSGNANVTVASQDAAHIVLNLLDGGNVVAHLTLNADGTDSLEVLHRAGTTTFTPVAATLAQAGGPTGSLLVDLGAATDFNLIVTGDDGVAPTGAAGDTVNTSNQGWAVKGGSGQSNDPGESIVFSFVNDNNNTTPHSIQDFKFTTQGYTGGMSTASITVKVFLSADHSVYDQVTFNTTENSVIQISQLDWSAVIPGTSQYHSGDPIYGVSILADPGNKGGFRLNGVEVGSTTNTPPPDLDFNGIHLTVTDGDGDTVTQTFNIHLDGDTGNLLTTEAIAGTSGVDNLTGTSGNNVLIGGPGNDTLTGNGGNDIFVLNSTVATNGHDVITDFNAGDSIVVDVANLNLNISTAQIAAFNSGPTGAGDQTHNSAFAGSNFFFNTTTNELWYSADNTAAHAIDLATISTGLPAAGSVHVM